MDIAGLIITAVELLLSAVRFHVTQRCSHRG